MYRSFREQGLIVKVRQSPADARTSAAGIFRSSGG